MLDSSCVLKAPLLRSRLGSPSPPLELIDQSRGRNNGVFTDVTWSQISNVPAPGLWVNNYNGTTSKITVASSPSIKVKYLTAIIWVYVSSLRDASEAFIAWRNAGTDSEGFKIGKSTAANSYIFTFIIYGTSGSEITLSSVPISIGWQQIAAVYDGARKKLYKNAVVIQDVAAAIGLLTYPTAGSMYIGCKNATEQFFSGKLAPPTVLNKPLSPDDIARIFRREKAFFGVS